jgi:hypothetical protein
MQHMMPQVTRTSRENSDTDHVHKRLRAISDWVQYTECDQCQRRFPLSTNMWLKQT